MSSLRARRIVVGATVLFSGAVITMTVLGNGRETGVPPAGGKAIAELLTTIEQTMSNLITEVEFNGDHWEIELREGDRWLTVYLDPFTGEEVKRRLDDAEEDRPPAPAIRLSEIARRVATEVEGAMFELDFENGRWEVDLDRSGEVVRVLVDPLTGSIQ